MRMNTHTHSVYTVAVQYSSRAGQGSRTTWYSLSARTHTHTHNAALYTTFDPSTSNKENSDRVAAAAAVVIALNFHEQMKRGCCFCCCCCCWLNFSLARLIEAMGSSNPICFIFIAAPLLCAPLMFTQYPTFKLSFFFKSSFFIFYSPPPSILRHCDI